MTAPATAAALDAADRRLAWKVGALALLLLAAGAPFGVPFSAGVAGALEILEGGWPCRDFWTLYAPGHFFLLAGLFAAFGRHLLVAALAAVVLEAVACALFFRLLRRLDVERRVAAAAALVLAGVLFRIQPTLTTYAPVLVCGMAGLERTLAAAAAPTARGALLAGACFGLAAWFKHDVAFYLCAAAAAALATAALAQGSPLRCAGRRAAALLAGAAAGVLPMAALVAITGGRDAWRDLVVFPLTDFPLTRPEKYPSLLDGWVAARSPRERASAVLQWIRHGVPIWLWVVLLVQTFRRRRAWPPVRRAGAAAALVAIPLLFAAAHVQINTHILSMSAVVIALLAAAWSDARARAAPHRGGRVALAGATLLLLAALAEQPARSAARGLDLLRSGRPIDAPAAAGIVAAPRTAAEIEWASRRVRELTAPGEPVYVGVARHDAVVISRPELHLFLDRPGSTRYRELHPGIVDREEVQREMAADLDRGPVRVIVLWHVGFPAAHFDALRERRRELLPGTGSTWLDEWIARRFESLGREGELELLQRRAAE